MASAGLPVHAAIGRRVAAVAVVVVLGVAGFTACAGDGVVDADHPAAATTVPGLARCAEAGGRPLERGPLEVAHAFDGVRGANPWGSLVLWQDRLVGRTRAGGDHGAGTIFGLRPDGSGYEVLRSYQAGPQAPGGNDPLHGHLSTVRGLLYGSSHGGGRADHGAISVVDPTSGGERVLHDFAGAPADGADPHGDLLVTSRGLWILTASGGAHDLGALIKVDPDTGATDVAHSFSGPDGAHPHGRVVRSGEKTLYGMTSRGGSADDGVIFSMDPDTYEHRVLHELGPGPGNGRLPHHGHLYEGAGSDKRLWGVTAHGGAHDQGVIFTITPDGSTFEVHHDFGAAPDDAVHPLGSLTWADGHFYGLASRGGRSGLGALFRIADDGGSYQVVASFDGATTGAFPYDDVFVYRRRDRAPVLYGTTGNGGRHDPDCRRALGVVFRLDVGKLP